MKSWAASTVWSVSPRGWSSLWWGGWGIILAVLSGVSSSLMNSGSLCLVLISAGCCSVVQCFWRRKATSPRSVDIYNCGMPIISLLHLADLGVSHDCFHRRVVINDIIDVTKDSFGMRKMGGDRLLLTTTTSCHRKGLHTRMKTRVEETTVRQSYRDRDPIILLRRPRQM